MTGKGNTSAPAGQTPAPGGRRSVPGRHARPRPGLLTPLRSYLSRLADLLIEVGDLLFAASDEEARWHAWDIRRRHAGLGRAYHDRRFDRLVTCLRCQRTGIGAGGPLCSECSAAGYLIQV